MKVERYKGIEVEIEFVGNKVDYELFPKLSQFFRIDKDNVFLIALGIDAKTFSEDKYGYIEIRDSFLVKEILCDGALCPLVSGISVFSIQGKEKVHLQIFTEKVYTYELNFKDPPFEPRKGKAFAGEEVELVIYGSLAKFDSLSLEATNKQTQEKFLIPLKKAEFPPNSFIFLMPSCDIILSMMELMD